MATRSSILAWKIAWTEEFGGLQSMGSQSQTQTEEFGGLQSMGSQSQTQLSNHFDFHLRIQSSHRIIKCPG